MLLGLGLHEIGTAGLPWVLVDVVWFIPFGFALGGALGTLTGRLVLYLRREHQEGIGLDELLALGLVALTYGAANLIHVNGVLAVFAAGLALRRVERRENEGRAPDEVREMARAGEREEIATDPERAPAYMVEAVLGFDEQLERIAEVGVVVLVGALLAVYGLPREALWFIPLLLLVVRPASVLLGLLGASLPRLQRRLLCWFGSTASARSTISCTRSGMAWSRRWRCG